MMGRANPGRPLHPNSNPAIAGHHLGPAAYFLSDAVDRFGAVFLQLVEKCL